MGYARSRYASKAIGGERPKAVTRAEMRRPRRSTVNPAGVLRQNQIDALMSALLVAAHRVARTTRSPQSFHSDSPRLDTPLSPAKRDRVVTRREETACRPRSPR